MSDLRHRDSSGRVFKKVDSYTRVEVSSSQNATDINRIYACTAHSITLTLESAIMEPGGWVYVNDESGAAGGVSQAITIATEGAETIDGSATVLLDANFEGVLLYSDGSNWFTAAVVGSVV